MDNFERNSMSGMKRVYGDILEDVLKIRFPEGVENLSQEDKELWEKKTVALVNLLLDSEASDEVPLDMNEGDISELSADRT